MNSLASNWGRVNSKKVFMNGAAQFTCERHGGIVVSRELFCTHPFFEKIKDIELDAFIWESPDYLVFEEHSHINIIYACLDDATLAKIFQKDQVQKIRETSLFSLGQHFPDIFSRITGIELSVFDSYKLREQLINSRNAPKLDCSLSGHNIPEGFCAISLTNNANLFYLISDDDLSKFREIKYFKSLPFDLSLININQPFELILNKKS